MNERCHGLALVRWRPVEAGSSRYGRPLMVVSGLLLMVCLLALAGSADAQLDYPLPVDPFVNDYARVISSRDAAYLRTTLAQLREAYGVEAVVVTINSLRDYNTGSETIESFATNLFNTWGIGHAERNDGALLLVAVQDRLVRLELGSGYDETYNDRMWTVINEHLVSDFRRGQYSQGIVSGVRALYRELTGQWPAAQPALTARPTQAVPTPPPSLPSQTNPAPLASAPPSSNSLLGLLVFAIILAGAAILAWNVFAVSDPNISLNNVPGPRWSVGDDSTDSSSHSRPGSIVDNSSAWPGSSSASAGNAASGYTSTPGSADRSKFGGGQSSGGGQTGSW
jgi:uncharacterized membrane protein YgcG